MSDILIAGNTYAGVPSITVPKVGGGFATFSEGGGSSPFTLITEQTVSVTYSGGVETAATIQCGAEIYTKDKIVWVHVRDMNGKRPGYFYGSEAFFVNANKGNGSTSTYTSPATCCLRVSTSGTYAGSGGGYGVYGYSIASDGLLTIRKRYSASYSGTIDGDFKISVYTIDLPGGIYLFE